jgi:hypothetical protein
MRELLKDPLVLAIALPLISWLLDVAQGYVRNQKGEANRQALKDAIAEATDTKITQLRDKIDAKVNVPPVQVEKLQVNVTPEESK